MASRVELKVKRKAGKVFVVIVVIPWIVRDARSPKEAVKIAISEVGKRIGDRVLSVSRTSCTCGRGLDAVLYTPGMTMVCLETPVKVVVFSEQEAVKVAKAIIGKNLPNTPLSVKQVLEKPK